VRVSVLRTDADHLEIQIRDSGPGILKENLSRIFERHWQARDTAHLGTGLGLFIARGIVKAHQGDIWAESEVGRGATFRIIIPTNRTALSATG
jgi:signal transduction histidine kinase